MAVLFDSSYLMNLLDPTVTGEGVIDARVQHLVKTLERSKTRIIVPTPALSELLIGAGSSAPQYLDIISRSSRFKVVPFGVRAAVEAAAAHREAILNGDKKEGSAVSWGKIKFDRQIVAIAKVEGVSVIYSNDNDIARFSARDGLEVFDFEQLPEPPERPQGELLLEPFPDEGGDAPAKPA